MNSILVSALSAADAFLCVLVALAACDYLRRVRPVDHPLLCTAFYLVAIGAFGAFVREKLNRLVDAVQGTTLQLRTSGGMKAHC